MILGVAPSTVHLLNASNRERCCIISMSPFPKRCISSPFSLLINRNILSWRNVCTPAAAYNVNSAMPQELNFCYRQRNPAAPA
jgi:hypothetical protein